MTLLNKTLKLKTGEEVIKKTVLAILGGKGGTGKTLLMAHIADKLASDGVSFLAYDFEVGDGTGLSRFFPSAIKSKLLNQNDLDQVVNQLALASLGDPLVTIVDFPANAGDAFLAWVKDIDWQDLRDQNIRFVLVLVLSEDSDSFVLALEWIAALGAEVTYAVVLNKGLGDGFLTYHRTEDALLFQHEFKPLEISFPEVPADIMLHLRNEGKTVIRAYDEKSGLVTVPGLDKKFMDKTRIKRLQSRINQDLKPLVDLITGAKL